MFLIFANSRQRQTAKVKAVQDLELHRLKQAETKNRIKLILSMQEMIPQLAVDEEAKETIRKGIPGKLKPVKEERIEGLVLLADLVFPDRKKPEAFDKQMEVAAEKLCYLTEPKKQGKCVKGVTYNEMRETIKSILNSGLFGETGSTSPTTQMLNQQQQQSIVNEVPQDVSKQIPVEAQQPQHLQQQAVHQQIVHPQAQMPNQPQSVYSFGTVGGVEPPQPDRDPAVVSMFPANGSIPTQIFNSSSYHGVYVPVNAGHQLPPGAHILQPTSGQFVATSPPQHYQLNDHQQMEGANLNNNQLAFDDQTGDQLNNNLENLKLTDGQVQDHGDNEFRVKDHRRNKFNNQGQKKDFDRNPTHQFDRHGSSSGFQRKGDRYQGNQRR